MPDETPDETPVTALVPRYRPTSRVLVLDSRDRLLLLLLEDPKLAIPRLWITPGGGVDPGETFEAHDENVTAVEDRDREQVDQSEVEADRCHQAEKRNPSELGRFPR